MKLLKAAIVEDEPVLRAELREALAAFRPELVVVGEAADGVEALALMKAQAPDVLFLDIGMPGASGLEIARQASGRCHVVFVTAHYRYAVPAFEAGAVDYVMKPFSAARLATTVARLADMASRPPADLGGVLDALAGTVDARHGRLRWIAAPQGTELRLIAVEEVVYFRAENGHTLAVTPDRASPIGRTIEELVDELDAQTFWRIRRGTLVNVDAIACVTRAIGGRIRLVLKRRRETLGVSAPYRHLFTGL